MSELHHVHTHIPSLQKENGQNEIEVTTSARADRGWHHPMLGVIQSDRGLGYSHE